jgi:hypothetical protein
MTDLLGLVLKPQVKIFWFPFLLHFGKKKNFYVRCGTERPDITPEFFVVSLHLSINILKPGISTLLTTRFNVKQFYLVVTLRLCVLYRSILSTLYLIILCDQPRGLVVRVSDY